jgi:hypothetical protein
VATTPGVLSILALSAQNVFRAHEDVRIELDHFLAQLAVEPSHD